MIRVLVTLLTVFTLTSGFSQEESKLIDKIVGIVGEKIVKRSDVEMQYQQFTSQKSPGIDASGTKCQILSQLLKQKMFLRQAEIDSIQITDKEVESELDRRIRYFSKRIGSEKKLEEYYGKSIEELKSDFREDIQEQMRSQRMRQKIFKDLSVSPSEVKSYYNSLPEDSIPYYNAEVELGQIVAKPRVNEAQQNKVKERLRNMRKRVVEGEQDFSTLAIMYSDDDQTAQDGGDLGYIERGEMVPKFEGAAFKLDSGEVSNVINTKYGYHLIQALGRKGDEVKVRHVLLKPKAGGAQYRAARNRLDSIRNILVNGEMTFKKAVKEFSEHEPSKERGGMIVNRQTGNARFEMDQLDPDLYFVIDSLQEGDYSEPVSFQTQEGEQAYRIVYLKNQTEPHKADLDRDYTKIKADARQRKKQKKLREWLKRKIDKTYIFVSPDYQDCDKLDIWMNNNNPTSRNSYE